MLNLVQPLLAIALRGVRRVRVFAVCSTMAMGMEGSGGGGSAKKKEESLPPGFRFHPTDEELITYYLRQKIADGGFTARAIAEVDLNKCEPWDLPGN